MTTFIKDPDERLDYTMDWDVLDYLAAGETIATSAWSVPAGITQYGTASNTTTTATIWLEGGTHGQEYIVSNLITTSASRKAERSIKIVCRNR